MGAMDHQIGFKDESTYGTPVVVDRFFEYESEGIEESEGRTEGDPLRTGGFGFMRNDRFTPYFSGAAGTVQLAVMSKGFGYFLKHMMGVVATTGPAETVVFTHTGTAGDLLGDFFTCQVNRPLHPAGTNQAFTYEGGKISKWGLSNAVDGNLLLDLDLDFEQVKQETALASASYPTSMDNLTWAGGLITIGGSTVDVSEIAIEVDNGLNVDRRKIRQNTDKKEPTSSRREGTFSFTADFDTMTARNRAHAATTDAASPTRAAALASFTGLWKGPTLLGTTLFPQLLVTIPQLRFDAWKGATEGTDAIEQELSGVIRYDGSASAVTLAYQSADATA